MATRRRGRVFILFALLLIMLLALAFVYIRFISGGITSATEQPVTGPAQVEPSPLPAQDVVEIVLTTQNIRRGQPISEGLVQLVAIPRDEFTEGVFFTTLEDVIGDRARYDLSAHTPLTNALVVDSGIGGSIASFEIPRGMVAISVPIGKLSSIAYGLQNGDHVNVIASLLFVDLDTQFQSRLPNRTGVMIGPGPIDENQTYVTAPITSPVEYTTTNETAYSYLGRIEIDPTTNNPVYVTQSEAQRPRLVSQTLVQDVVVLNVGYFPLEEEAAADAATDETTQVDPNTGQPVTDEEEATAAPEVVTLIVSPQQAVTLNYLMLANASLNLVLRSAGDDQQISTEAVTLQFVMDQYQIPNPAKLPYGIEPRIDLPPDHIPAFPDPGVRNTPTPSGD